MRLALGPRLAAALLTAWLLTIPAAATGAESSWPTITPGEWVATAQNDKVQVFVKPAQSGAYRRAWMRTEYREPDIHNGIITRSTVFLQEYDCNRALIRDLEFRSYIQNNMQEVRLTDVTADDWAPAPAGTLRGVVLAAVCGDSARTSQSAPVAAEAADTPPAVWPKLTEGAWSPFGASDEVRLYATLSLPTTWVRGWMRYEFLRPQPAAAGPYQSVRVLSEYDCNNKRSRAVLEVRYAGSNLEGAIDISTPVAQWEKFDMSSGEGEVAEALCAGEATATAELAAQQRARGEAVLSLQQITAMLDRFYGHVRTGQWHALRPTETAKLFVRGTKAGAHPQVEMRWEYLEPLILAGAPVRSSWHVVELNCATFQYRFAQTIGYPQSNLKGDGVRVARSTDWLPMSGDYEMLRMVCDRQLETGGEGLLTMRDGRARLNG